MSDTRKKHKSRNVYKGKVMPDGQVVLRDWHLTTMQSDLLSLFNFHGDLPHLGPLSAHGFLNIGPVIGVKDGQEQRKSVKSIYTKNNLADHMGFYTQVFQFFEELKSSGIVPPDEVVIGAENQVRRTFDEQVVAPLRKHLFKKGVDGVTCWFYVCPIIQSFSDSVGNIGFRYGAEWPLTLLPRDPKIALKKWNISPEKLAELSLTAAFLAFVKVPQYHLIVEEKTLINLLGGWRDYLPTRLDDTMNYFRKTSEDDENSAWYLEE